MSHDCATVNQYHNAILQFNGVLSFFTTGSNTTAFPDIATGVVLRLSLGLGFGCLLVVVSGVVIGVLGVLLWREDQKGWCTYMSCTCNCRSYYFVMWACWIHAQASLVTAGKFEGKCCSNMIMNVDCKLPNSTK